MIGIRLTFSKSRYLVRRLYGDMLATRKANSGTCLLYEQIVKLLPIDKACTIVYHTLIPSCSEVESNIVPNLTNERMRLLTSHTPSNFQTSSVHLSFYLTR
uniref:Uncharacterized protein n=1 Tax=Cacopsylla melanoneura TaxID=428564 RepID=A0A8D8X7T2_9HEMI